MMKMTILAAAAAFGLLAVVPATHARDTYTGAWGGDCTHHGAQCWLDIRKTGKAYAVSFIAAERMDASMVLCRVDTTMERGPVNYDIHNTFPDALSGALQDGFAFIAPDSNGGAVGLGGGLGAGFACEKFVMQGHYYFIGD